ncbi:MAG: uracil-DNA glycosylase family protein [Chthoniobacterales bacterium]
MNFQDALQVTEPLLKAMQNNLRAKPKASTSSLEKLLKMKSPKKEIPLPEKKEPIASIALTPSSLMMEANPDRVKKLEALKKQALACVRCPNLVSSRTQVVFGVGNPTAELMFVGEAPGADEDLQGEPFVGRAGKLLTKIINAMEYQREEIFIANVLKCRPNMPPNTSGNRKPTPDEMATCVPWLIDQINLIKPRVLVALGATAVEGLLGRPMTMREARGNWFDFHGIPLIATYHPAYLLYSHSLTEKRKVWEDMLQVLEKLGRPISDKQRGYFLAQ